MLLLQMVVCSLVCSSRHHTLDIHSAAAAANLSITDTKSLRCVHQNRAGSSVLFSVLTDTNAQLNTHVLMCSRVPLSSLTAWAPLSIESLSGPRLIDLGGMRQDCCCCNCLLAWAHTAAVWLLPLLLSPKSTSSSMMMTMPCS